jgi:hypothetical protein
MFWQPSYIEFRFVVSVTSSALYNPKSVIMEPQNIKLLLVADYSMILAPKYPLAVVARLPSRTKSRSLALRQRP